MKNKNKQTIVYYILLVSYLLSSDDYKCHLTFITCNLHVTLKFWPTDMFNFVQKVVLNVSGYAVSYCSLDNYGIFLCHDGSCFIIDVLEKKHIFTLPSCPIFGMHLKRTNTYK